jgi:hypothetical protein
MNLRSKAASPGKFLLFTTAYLIISLVAFLIPGGAYSLLAFLIYMGTFYLFVWLFMALTCAISKKVHYIPTLTYPILFVQVIAVLFNIPDSGYFGIGCNSKNFIQSFFDRADNCNGQWLGVENYVLILYLYMFLTTIFVVHIIWLKFTFSEDR